MIGPRISSRLGSRSNGRVLLVNPPVYDIKFHWPKWHVPEALLSVGNERKKAGSDICLLDCLLFRGKQIQRKLVGITDADGTEIQTWRFGLPAQQIEEHFSELRKEKWNPQVVVIEGFTTFWWQGVIEIGQLAKRIWPKARIQIEGAYGEYCLGHVQELLKEASGYSRLLGRYPRFPDFSFYGDLLPQTLSVPLPTRANQVSGFIEKIKTARKKGVTEFSIRIRNLGLQAPILSVLRSECEKEQMQIPFDLLGCVAPHEFIEFPGTVKDLRALGLRHVCFSDDRYRAMGGASQFLDNCARATELFHQAGYRERTDSVSAGLCIGRKGESLEERTRAAVQLNHSVGSTIIWPYQPLPDELPGVGLSDQNGKLFPFRQFNGHTYKDYAELVALNAVLNSRYRDCSFDFLGDGLIPSLLASSVAREGWNPDEMVKGPLSLPLRQAS